MSFATLSIIIGVVLLIFLKLFFKEEGSSDQDKGLHLGNQDDLFKEEPDVDPSWSVLPGNVWHLDDN